MQPEGVDLDVWQGQLEDSYKAIRTTLAYQDILVYLDMTREASLSKAEDATDVNYAYGLLQNAQACKTIKSYIERMTS